MSREDTPVTEDIDPGPIVTTKTPKSRAPGLALRAMEELQVALAARDIPTDHWRSVPAAVLKAIDELRDNPLIPVAAEDPRIEELREGLYEIGHEALEPHEPLIGHTLSLLKEADRLALEQEKTIEGLSEQAGVTSVALLAATDKAAEREAQLRELLANYDALVGESERLRQSAKTFYDELRVALGWRGDVAGSVPAAITKLRNDLSSVAAQLDEARATKDMHKERFQEETMAHAVTANDLAQTRGLLADANNRIELQQSDVDEMDAKLVAQKATIRMLQDRLNASWWRRLFKSYGE